MRTYHITGTATIAAGYQASVSWLCDKTIQATSPEAAKASITQQYSVITWWSCSITEVAGIVV